MSLHPLREASPALDARLASLVESVLDEWGLERAPSSPFLGVLLAGQGTRIFTTAEYLCQRFPTQEIASAFQENAVSRGLSSQVGVLGGQRKDLLLLDINCRPILVRVMKMWPRREEDDQDAYKSVILETDRLGYWIGEVSSRMNDNQLLCPIVEVATTIPTRNIHLFRAANAGTLTFDIVEGNRNAKAATEVLASLTVGSVAKGDEFELLVGIDANTTFHFSVYDRKTRSQLAAARYRYDKGRAQNASKGIDRG